MFMIWYKRPEMYHYKTKAPSDRRPVYLKTLKNSPVTGPMDYKLIINPGKTFPFSFFVDKK